MSRPDTGAADGPDMAAMRESYSLAGLSEADLAPDWLTQFRTWLAQTRRRRAARTERHGRRHRDPVR